MHAHRAPPPRAAEDMWHAYNLIREGDHVTATTFRKVSRWTAPALPRLPASRSPGLLAHTYPQS